MTEGEINFRLKQLGENKGEEMRMKEERESERN